MGLTHLSYSSMLMISFSGLQETSLVTMDWVASQLSVVSMLVMEIDSSAFQDLKLLQFLISTAPQILMCLAYGYLEWTKMQ